MKPKCAVCGWTGYGNKGIGADVRGRCIKCQKEAVADVTEDESTAVELLMRLAGSVAMADVFRACSACGGLHKHREGCPLLAAAKFLDAYRAGDRMDPTLREDVARVVTLAEKKDA